MVVSEIVLWGDQNIIIFSLKTAPLTIYSVEKWDRKNIADSMSSSSTNSSIALRVRSKYDLRCLTRKLATRRRVTTVQSLSSTPTD